MARVLIFVLLIYSASLFAQTPKSSIDPNNPKTILWKITGKDCKGTSYIVATYHEIGADWLNNFAEVKTAINISDKLLSEAYTTDENSASQKSSPNRLKAIPLLTKAQFESLDSFFVARIGEGIKNNSDAEKMSPFEMFFAVYETLYTDKNGKQIKLESMDLDLFNIFKQKGKKVVALDNRTDLDFDSSSISKAKRAISLAVEAAKTNTVQNEFNLADTTSLIGKIFHSYKQLSLDYKLNQVSPDIDFLAANLNVEQRNFNWMPAIKANISKQSCLIAVGFKHLWYQTGLVGLLRMEGYTVEPVVIKQ